eukprot:368174_1
MFFRKLWLIHVRRFSDTYHQCVKCNINRLSSEFYAKPSNIRGIESCCKYCRIKRQYERKCTPNGFLRKLIHSARGNQKTRYRKQNLQAPDFVLNISLLQDIYTKQNGFGFYSHVPLTLRPLSDWQASLERLNPDLDYTYDNVVLEALEFNCRCQWSEKKVIQIPSLIYASSNITINDLNEAKLRPKKKSTRNRKSLFEDNKYYCHHCHQWMSPDQFYRYTNTMCKSCDIRRCLDYGNTLRGYMNRMLHTSKNNARKKKSSGDDSRDECTLTLDNLFELLETQNFRCKYSGIPMTFTTNRDWRCSLERIDNMKGYIKDNVVLICFEFNSTDASFGAKNYVFGSAQWTREKFVYFYKIRFEQSV